MDEREAQSTAPDNVPPELEPLDDWLRRDGERWRGRVQPHDELSRQARALATLAPPKLAVEPAPAALPASTSTPNASGIRHLFEARRGHFSTVLASLAAVLVVALMLAVVHGATGSRGAIATTATPHPAAPPTKRPLPTVAGPATATPATKPHAGGAVLWQYTTGVFLYQPTESNNTVYLVNGNGVLMALDAASGTRRWAVNTGSTPNGDLVVANGAVYAAGLDGSLAAYSTDHGRQLWRDTVTGAMFGPPSVANGTIYSGTANNDASAGRLYALNSATGTTLWTAPLPRGGATAAPIVAGNVVYLVAHGIGGGGNTLCAVSLSGHSLLWQTPASGYALAVANGVVYTAGGAPEIAAYTVASGVPLWSKQLDTRSEIGVSPPTVFGGIVYAGAGNGMFYALDAATGGVLWTYQTGGEIFSVPANANGVVYVGSVDGGMYAIHATAGTLLWSYHTGGMVESSAVVANGAVYVTSTNNTLYALAP